MRNRIGVGLVLLLAGLLLAWEAQAQCTPAPLPLQPAEPLELNTVVVRALVKTIKVEKEVFVCDLDGDFQPDRIRDVQLFTEVIERRVANDLEIVAKRFEAITCEKDILTARLLGCTGIRPPSLVDPRFANCKVGEQGGFPPPPPSDPVEMNTVVIKGTIDFPRRLVKTVKVQKEVFGCGIPEQPIIVDLNTFTEIIEKERDDRSGFDVVRKSFERALCVKGLDGTVRGCGFF